MICMAQFTITNVYDGQKGDQGETIDDIIHEYTISTSSTELINPSWANPNVPEWSETPPAKEDIDENHFEWRRFKTVLTDGTIIYSNAVCEVVTSGVISQVNKNTQSITNKVWEDDITTQINEYDDSTISTIRQRVTQTEQNISGITTRVSDVETTTGNLGNRMTSAESSITQNSNKISAMVTVDGETSELTLTDKMIEAVTEQFVVKSPDGRRTVISGGLLLTDAIQSNNYQAPTGNASSETGTYPYSANGSLFDLSKGNIYTKNFVLDNDNGNAYLSGTIETGAGHIGGFVITENSIYHNKRDVSSVDLDDSVYIINNDPYVLDDEDYLYGGYATLYEVYMGTDGISCGFGKFAVDSTGELFASNATIQGNITATSLNVGSAEDSNHLIYSNGTIDLSTDWLKFDSGTITIGDEDGANAYLDPDTFKITNANEIEFFAVDMDGAEKQFYLFYFEQADISGTEGQSYSYDFTIGFPRGWSEEGTFTLYFDSYKADGSGNVRNFFRMQRGTASSGIDGSSSYSYDGACTITVTRTLLADEAKWSLEGIFSVTSNTPVMAFGTRGAGEKGKFSATFGEGLIAEADHQVVIGKYNGKDDDASFIIGNSANIFTVKKGGDVYAKGDYYSGVEEIELGTMILPAILTTTGSELYFTIPTGRLFPSGTTVSLLRFNMNGRAGSSDGQGYYIIRDSSGGTDTALFWYGSTGGTTAFYNANNNQKPVTQSMWTVSLQGGTNILVRINGGENYFFSGNATKDGYLNNQPVVLYLSNVTVGL